MMKMKGSSDALKQGAASTRQMGDEIVKKVTTIEK
jgi:hypothetical protein